MSNYVFKSLQFHCNSFTKTYETHLSEKLKNPHYITLFYK